jgi:NADH:ubiquinone oxidoreductase subunit 6 (subunit J)
VYAGAVLAIFLFTLRHNRIEFPSARTLLTVRTPGLLLIPALLFANGLMPYLGLKTETSFAMYSNLRTEGGYSNHWLMPASLQVWDYQRDLSQFTARRPHASSGW